MTEPLADNVRAFLSAVNLAVIGTSNRDGTVHQTALWYMLDGDSILMNTGTASKKVRNLRARPWASVCVYSLDPPRHVTLAGPVELDDSRVIEDLTAIASRYVGAEAGAGVAGNIAKVPHITLRLRAEKVTTFGKI